MKRIFRPVSYQYPPWVCHCEYHVQREREREREREMFCENFIYVYFICAGEFGVVYKGWYTSDDETVEVAIKRMKGCIFEYM